MEKIIPIEPLKSFDGYHDSLTHHYAAPVFYDALKREVSFAKREGHKVGIVRLQLLENTSMDQMLFFANELELCVRHHDLIARVGQREFAVLLRFDFAISAACECLLQRLATTERREFLFSFAVSDGTKGVEELLDELENPQFLQSSKTL
jgi:GGDEF domain-containing protein